MKTIIPKIELAHEKHGHLYPPILYWLGAQLGSEKMGVKNGVIGVWTTGHEFSYMTAEGGLAKAGKKILAKLEKDEKLLKKIVTVNSQEIPIMLRAAKKLSGNLSKLTGKQLAVLYQDWLKKFLSMMTYSILGTVMEMEMPLLSEHLGKILVKHLGKNHPKLGEYFQILTTATQPTIAATEELELLNLKKKQLLNKLSHMDIINHRKKYSWVAFGYDGPGWTDQDIVNRLNTLSSNLTVIKSNIKNKQEQYLLLKKKQASLTKQLQLNLLEQRLFESMRTLGFWKVQRKLKNQQAHELMENFINEVASRNFLSAAQVKMISPTEMISLLKGKKISTEILNERLKESLVIFNGVNFKIISGTALKPISAQIKKSLEVDASINSLNGQTAYPGKARGKVKIVDTLEEMGKVKKGDILVSASTSPQILPAMKKAGAIVTNSGGITCHAAIVAREIKIPTLIGTKIATKVFKDGDLVEVDANKGMVKKI